MGAETANLVEFSSIQVRDACRHQGCDISECELKSTATTQVEQQSANNIYCLCEEVVKSGNELANGVPGTKVAHGQLRLIELGSTDSKRCVHSRRRW